LRRLAVYAMSLWPDKSPDERLDWLLKGVDIYAQTEQHCELYSLATSAYSSAGVAAQQQFVEHICSSQPTTAPEEQTIWARYNWLTRLQRTTPDCKQIQAGLVPVKKPYPEWLVAKGPIN